MALLVNNLADRAAVQLKYVRDDLVDQNFLSKQVYSRIHSVFVVAVLEGAGFVAGILNGAVLLTAKVLGEALYLPTRVFNKVQYTANALRGYGDRHLCKTASLTARLGAGAISSAIVGFLDPATNVSFQAKLFPGKI